MYTFIDLFAGIGGTRKGFENAGGTCVLTSEWDKFAQQTYAANFNTNHLMHGDITTLPSESVPPFDVLVAGFPCQTFSLSGIATRRNLGMETGFNDQIKGTMFFEVARILHDCRPSAFVLENVKNLRSHDKGRTFRIIEQVLTAMGYHLTYEIIDGARYVPQHRERIYIVGSLQGPISFNALPIPRRTPTLGDILHPEDGTESPMPPFTEAPQGTVADKYTLRDGTWSWLQAHAAKHAKAGNGYGFSLADRNGTARTLSARYHKDGSEILIPQTGQNPRKLTPRECARLMGFDDSFVIPVSDTQAYKQFGNSVVVPLVTEIAKRVAASLPQSNIVPLFSQNEAVA